MRQAGRGHYVSHNSVTRVPRSFVYLDTEARRAKVRRREVQTFRLAVAAFDTRNRHTGLPRAREWHQSTDTSSLWEWVTSKCQAKNRTVLVAHNLAYDLRISNAFAELPRLGWSFVAGRVDAGQAWVIWRNGQRSLTCVDSMSWVPIALEKLGELCGIPKLALPDEDDSEADWFARCRRDVEILAEVWQRLVRWVEDDDLGNWKLSGAGQSWAAFRHRFMAHRLLVHEDDDARAAERAAAHTGRCEAWQHGKLIAGPYTEWDFTTAYALIGAECDVPVRLEGELFRPSLEKVLRFAGTKAVLCEVEVTTDAPVLAYRDATGIRWPVGSFRTTAWSNELRLALDGGADVVVTRAWVYGCEPALRDFCTWVLAGLDGSRRDVDPVVRVALKHWSRALIGRTAMRTSTWEACGTAASSSACVGPVYEYDEGERWRMMQVGRDLFRETDRRDGRDAMVAVMSWVMAESRCRLWEAMSTAGLGSVCYVDTDSLIVNPVGSAALASARIPGLRIKGEWSTIEVLGPRQLIPGATLRAAGVPRGAVRIGDRVWSSEVWSGLASSLADREADRVTVTERTFRLTGRDRRRRHLPGGRTEPLRVDELSAPVPVTAAV